MGKTQSKPTQEEYDECKAKVKDFEKQLKQCSARDHNQMESSQTNVGIFSLGVENNSNGFLFIRFVKSYIARRRMWKKEGEMVGRKVEEKE